MEAIMKFFKDGHRGMIMVATLMLLPICIILGATMLRILVQEKYFLQHETNLGQTFYMAESGLTVAYRSFLEYRISDLTAVQGYTHFKQASDGPEVAGVVSSTGYLTIPPAIDALIPFRRIGSGDREGWYEYNWIPGDVHESLTGTGLRERIRFRVSHTGWEDSASRPSGWEIVCEATLGGITKTHRLTGKLEGFFDYAILGKGDINEFIRGADQFIQGKVHANGNIFFRLESGRTLTVRTDSMAATGKFVYGVDAAGRPSSGFTVKVSRGSETGSLVTWTPGLQSDSSSWHSPSSGVLALFGGTVKDGQLNVYPKSAPPVESFEPNGFYFQKAQSGGLLISTDAGGAPLVNGVPLAQSDKGPNAPLADRIVREVRVRNHIEARDVNVYEIDVSKLDSDDYPNGLVYSELPVVLSNAQKLPQKSTFVSQSTIFTRGDFNKELATLDDYDRNKGTGPYAAVGPSPAFVSKKPAALITKDRIIHLSKSFSLSTGVAKNAMPGEAEEYPGDNVHVNRSNSRGSAAVIEVNAALIDGAPLFDEVENRMEDPNGGPPIPSRHYSVPSSAATSWDDFLENLGAVVVKKRGSIIHLDNATLPATLTVTNPPPGVLAWHRSWSSHYTAPVRDYGYDILLKYDPPPFQPVTATRILWQAR
jgi:hypothetical protein